jgi:glutamate/aspartate transport system substrate-binding protein
MMDDVLLAGTRSQTAKPSDWALVGTPQSSEAYGFMMRKDDPEFKKLVDDAMSQVMRSPEIKTLYDKWFTKPMPPKNINFEFPMSGAMQKLFAEPNDKAFE